MDDNAARSDHILDSALSALVRPLPPRIAEEITLLAERAASELDSDDAQ